MKICKICGHEIPDSAKKCTVCGSFQNWRGHINFSSTILALLVALISVVATSIPVLSEMFDQDDSDVNLVFQLYDVDKANKYNYYFIAANSGTRPAGIGKATYRIEMDSKYLKNEEVNYVNKNSGYEPEKDNILLIGETDVAMLSGNGELSAPFLQPNSSHQMSLRLKMREKSLRAFKQTEETLAMHATDPVPDVNQKLAISDRNILKILSGYQQNVEKSTEKCSILFDIINYNSEIEKQAVDVDCAGILTDISSNYGKNKRSS